MEIRNIKYTVKVPAQKCIQHHGVTYPNHNDHLGLTTKDHTWPLHEELLEHGQNFLRYQGFQWMETVLHASKKFRIQPRI